DARDGPARELRFIDDQHAWFGETRRVLLVYYSARSTTILRFTLAWRKSSNAPGSSLNAIVRHISLRSGGRMSVASRRQTSRRSSGPGLSVELMPSRLTPRKMNGITVVLRFGLAARPIDAITPFCFIVLAIQARTSPPRF